MQNDDKLKNIKESLLAVMRGPHRWLLLVGTGVSVAMDAQLGMPVRVEAPVTQVLPPQIRT